MCPYCYLYKNILSLSSSSSVLKIGVKQSFSIDAFKGTSIYVVNKSNAYLLC